MSSFSSSSSTGSFPVSPFPLASLRDSPVVDAELRNILYEYSVTRPANSTERAFHLAQFATSFGGSLTAYSLTNRFLNNSTNPTIQRHRTVFQFLFSVPVGLIAYNFILSSFTSAFFTIPQFPSAHSGRYIWRQISPNSTLLKRFDQVGNFPREPTEHYSVKIWSGIPLFLKRVAAITGESSNSAISQQAENWNNLTMNAIGVEENQIGTFPTIVLPQPSPFAGISPIEAIRLAEKNITAPSASAPQTSNKLVNRQIDSPSVSAPSFAADVDQIEPSEPEFSTNQKPIQEFKNQNQNDSASERSRSRSRPPPPPITRYQPRTPPASSVDSPMDQQLNEKPRRVRRNEFGDEVIDE